jgi:hypothetical protein
LERERSHVVDRDHGHYLDPRPEGAG